MRLGPYEILQPLGAGGMGEVYRARDTRLGRDVAIKVLPAHLSENEERRQRFEREARTISQLSHPHICALYDVGRQDGTDFLVMEYIEGEALSERLARGALPAELLLRYGMQIADALDRAHRQGIVHRDLKPGNVMLTKSGVKLLDFGLAKFMATPSAVNLSVLPTEGARPLTDTGQILGTLQYMSPEQLEGQEADARSDIFAFGTVLYEMATGQRAFTGKSQASLIAAILQTEPKPISAVSPVLPPALDRLVRVCLAKDPEDRWQGAHDVMLQLQWIAEGGSQAGISTPLAGRRRRGEKLAWSISGTLLLAAVLLGVAYWRSRATPAPSLRLSVLPPEGTAFSFIGEGSGAPAPVAISPDGKRLVFGAQDTERVRLYVRSLDSFETRPLEGTDQALFPFWSPDGAWIGFFQRGQLKKISAAGGPPEVIADAPNARGGSWSPDGTIVFAPKGFGALLRVSEKGGDARPVTFPAAPESDVSHRFPSFLRDGRNFVYLAGRASEKIRDEDLGIFLGSTDSRQTVRLLPDLSNAIFALPGFLLFRRGETLMALPFDTKTLRATGTATPVAEKIEFSTLRSFGVFSASATGVLVYRASPAYRPLRLSWVDRSGKPAGAPEIPPAVIWDVRLAPDGKRAVLSIFDSQTGRPDLWSYDIQRGARARLTSGGSAVGSPVWSPDSRRVVFDSFRAGGSALLVTDSSGEGKPELLSSFSGEGSAQDWSSDGRWILFQLRQTGGNRKFELWVWSVQERKASPFLQSESNTVSGAFSPDGRWVVYQSNESGEMEVSVRPFPGPGARVQISRGGGTEPRWSRDGREIAFLGQTGKLMAVEVKTRNGFEASEPLALFALPANAEFRDITNDHQRVLVAAPLSSERSPAPVSVVTNWFAGLSR